MESHARTKGGGEEMPTCLRLALMTSSLHRIADHCKRYEVTSADVPRVVQIRLNAAAQKLIIVRLDRHLDDVGVLQLRHNKPLNMLWLQSII